MSQLFRQTFQKKVPDKNLNELLPLWVESTLPTRCVVHKNVVNQFNPSSQIDNRGPLGTLGPADSIFTASLTTNWPAERGLEAQMGENTTRTKKSKMDPMVEFTGYKGDIFADKSNWNPKFFRLKRYVGGLGAGGIGPMFGGIGAPADPGAPPREITEAEQMMNTMLMFTNFQKTLHATELNRFRKGSQNYDKPTLGNGMYGDRYYGRRRREATPLSRRKRFLFGGSEPGDPLPINPLFDIYGMMAGTAVDPNTGKRVEFGGDAMTNLVANTYMSMLPMGNPAPPGHEPPEMFKNMANMWYFNTIQNVMSPPRSRTLPTQIRRNGYYGDTFPGKKRKKRTVSGLLGEENLANGPVDLVRSRRQAEEVKIENTPATTPQKPVVFYGNQAFYGDPLYPTGQATGYDRAMSSFRRILLRNQKLRQQYDSQKLRQQYEKQRESLNAPYGNYRNPERSQFTNTNYQQQVAPPLYVPASPNRMPPPTQAIPYQAHPTNRPVVDPFIIGPATKESFDPFAQGLDPFIPNPTTTPAPVTTAPPAESGKRKKRSDESAFTAGEEAHARLRRANSHREFETPYPDFYYPPPFYGFGFSNGFYNPYESRYFSNGGYDNMKPYKSSYLANNGEVIYGDRPSWPSNGYSGNSRSKRSGNSNNDFFFFGGFEGERGNKKDEKSYDRGFYGNGFEGQFYGEYPPWFFNGESYHSEKSRSKRSEGRNQDFFYFGDYGNKKEEKGKDKSYYGNGFDGQFFGDYPPWFFNGEAYHSEKSRSKRSEGRNNFFYFGDYGNKKEEKVKDRSYYGNGFDSQFFGEYPPWFFNGEAYHSEKSRSKRSDGRNHDFFYFGDYGNKKEEKGKDKSYYGNGFDGQFFGEYPPWFSNGNYEGHSERSRWKRSDGGGNDFYHKWGYEGDRRGYLGYHGFDRPSYSNGLGERFYGEAYPNGGG